VQRYQIPDPAFQGLNLANNTLVRGLPSWMGTSLPEDHVYPAELDYQRFRDAYARYLGLPGPSWVLPCAGALGGLDIVIRFWKSQVPSSFVPIAVIQDGAYPPMVDLIRQSGYASFEEWTYHLDETEWQYAFVASPHNPLGTIVRESELVAMGKFGAKGICIDGAYRDYYLGRGDLPALFTSFPRVVIIRSASKIGLAGLRAGVIVAGPEVLEQMERLVPVPMFAVPARGLVLGYRLLGTDEGRRWLEETVRRVREHRWVLRAEMSRVGKVVSTDTANFVTVETEDPEKLEKWFREQGIQVRVLINRVRQYPNLVRITVPEQASDMEYVLERLGRYEE